MPGIPADLSAGQVVWAPPPSPGSPQSSVVYVGWPSYSTNFGSAKRLGMIYCLNRPCALYSVEAPTGGGGREPRRSN